MDLALSDHLSEKGIDKWISAVAVTNAPMPRQNVREALRFFALHMPSLKTDVALSFIRCMDLSKAVRAVRLGTNERLIAFRAPTEDPLKLFYTRSGASVHRSGVNPGDRTAQAYKVRVACHALQSFTSGAKDTWTRAAGGEHTSVLPRANTTGVLAPGGGVQLIVPNAHSVLLFER